MSNVTVYSFADATGLTTYVDSVGDFLYTGTWSSSGTYLASPLRAADYGNGLYMCIRDNIGDNPQRTPTRLRPTSWSIMSVLYEYQADGSNSSLDLAAWNLAQIGTNTGTAAYNLAGSAYGLAESAYALAMIGTNTGTAALNLAAAAYSLALASGTQLATDAYALAQIGTNTGTAALNAAAGAQATADAAFSIAVAGTNAAAEAATSAADAYRLAMVGTNTGTAALAAAAGAQATADAAFLVAVAGTNAATTAQSRAEEAYALAQIGTNTGTAALTAASSAQATADAAFNIAVIGTNTGTAALAAAAGAQATADAAFLVAVDGTNAAAAAASVANSAWTLAQVGTNTGTAALVAASAAQSTANSAFALAQIGTNTGSVAYSVAEAAWALAQQGTIIPPLSSLPDVSLPAPFVNQVLTFDGSRWTAVTPVSIPGAGVGFSYYLNGESTELPGYEQLVTIPETGTNYAESVTIAGSNTALIDQYVSGTFGRTSLDGGIWVYHSFASATGTNSCCQIEIRTSLLSGSIDTALWSLTTPVLAPSVIDYSVEIFGSPVSVNTDDRLVVRYYGVHTDTGTATITLYHGGTLNQTHIDTPFALVHNELSGLQGGTTNQFYHVTQLVNEALNAAVTPSGTNPFVTNSDSRLLDAQIARSTASSAWALAQVGTNTGTAALTAASIAQATADAAFLVAVAGTNAAAAAASVANSAWALAQIGTNTGTAALTAASIAQATADAAFLVAAAGTSAAANAYRLAMVGTNTGTAAYNLAQSGSNVAWAAWQLAQTGTIAASVAQSTANSAWALAQVGTNTGTAALAAASIAQATADAAFLVAVDGTNAAASAYQLAMVGTNTGTAALVAASAAQSTASSAFALAQIGTNTGTAAYNLAQSGSNLAWAAWELAQAGTEDGVQSILGTANQVIANGVTGTAVAGSVTLTLPQDIGTLSTVNFASGSFSGGVQANQGVFDAVDFSLAPINPINRATGRLWWNKLDDTLNLGMGGTAVTQQIGEESLIHVFNNAGTTIPNGSAVYMSGANGTYATINLASAAIRAQSRGVVGLTTEDILPGATGYVTSQGLVRGLDTSALTVARPLFLSTTPGQLTLAPPPPPYSTVFIGIVIAQNGSEGAVYVDLRSSSALAELQDVSIPTSVAGQTLRYNGSVWQAVFPSGEVSHATYTYYLDGTFPAFPGYEALINSPAGGTEVIETVSVTSAGSVLIDQYISGTFGRTLLDGGAWLYQTYAKASRQNNFIQVKTYVLSGTTETPLWNFTTTELPTAVGPVPTNIYGTETSVNTTDRLLVRYYAVRTGAGSANVSLYHNGNTHYTYIQTPFPSFHNELAGLQGGDGVDSFFHLSGTQYSQFDSTVVTADTALALAQIGTNAASTAQDRANDAYRLAMVGTNTGTSAYNLANSAYNLATANNPTFNVLTVTTGTAFPISPGFLVYLANSSGGQIVVALPEATNWTGKIVHVKKISSDDNTIIVRSTTGTATVDGILNQTFTAPYMSLQLTTNGTNWFIL